MWWERSSKIARRSSCGRSHQAADFRIGIKAALVADCLPRLSWRASNRERSALVTYRSKAVTPLSTQLPGGGCASCSVTSSRDIQARGTPMTGSTRRTRQDPTLPPTNDVMSPTRRDRRRPHYIGANQGASIFVAGWRVALPGRTHLNLPFWGRLRNTIYRLLDS